MKDTRTQVRLSALWAAYGDALGFITELADGRMVKRRVGGAQAVDTVPWRRRVGGKFGAELDLLPGTYSDDTQLRLATSRAIRHDGRFDAEAFAKIELPVWLGYALGGGRGSRTAAAHLSRPDVNWFSNFFHGRSSYVDGGGNGAAMRVQPHLWAAKHHKLTDEVALDVIRNAICTHGHMRGVAGALFHAHSLSAALSQNQVPGMEIWKEGVECLAKIPALVRQDPNLRAIWLPAWEQRAGGSLDAAVKAVQEECWVDLQHVQSSLDGDPESAYHRAVEQMGARNPAARGSGTKCAILASLVSWLLRDEGPYAALLLVSNTLQTDTDTIATMAGAIMGSVAEEAPSGEILDRGYIESDADRLARLSEGQEVQSFQYPDLLRWTPPEHQVDVVGLVDGRVAVAGLGLAKEIGKPYVARSSQEIMWQWYKLDFGQTVAAKRRAKPRELPVSQWPVSARVTGADGVVERPERVTRKRSVFDPVQGSLPLEAGPGMPSDRVSVRGPAVDIVDQLTDQAIRSRFDPTVIGQHMRVLAEKPNGVELCIAYSAIIAKALVSRRRQSR